MILLDFELRAHYHNLTSSIDRTGFRHLDKTISFHDFFIAFCTLKKGKSRTMVLQERGFLHTQKSRSSAQSVVCNPTMSVDRRIRLSGHLLRTEPSNVEWMQKLPQALEKVKKIGWYNMFERITEHHVEVTKAFFQSFDGSRVQIGG